MTYNIESMDDGDVGTLVSYGVGFWDLTPYCDKFDYNPVTVKRLVLDMADNHYLRVAKNEEGKILGMIGFLLYPLVFNDEVITGTEVFFFTHPKARGMGVGEALLDRALEDLEPIVDILSVGDMSSSMHMIGLYRKKGFTLSERTYTKVL